MPRINSREQLKEYALRTLGAPVLLINVDDSQLEDRIDDALDLWWEYHNSGTELSFLFHQITAQEIADQRIILPEGVMSVLRVLGPNSGDGGGSTGIATINLQYQMYITDIWNARRIMQGGMGSFFITQSYLNTIQDTFSTEDRLNFNMHHGRLTLLNDWAAIKEGNWISIEAYTQIDPTAVGSVYNDRWLKKYVTAQFKLQWGSNLIKFAGAQLPGGMTVNAEQIWNDAKEEVKALEEELKSDYQLPCDFFVG